MESNSYGAIVNRNATKGSREEIAENIRKAKAEGQPWETDKQLKAMSKEEAEFKLETLRENATEGELTNTTGYKYARQARLRWAVRNGKSNQTITKCSKCNGAGQVYHQTDRIDAYEKCDKCFGMGEIETIR